MKQFYRPKELIEDGIFANEMAIWRAVQAGRIAPPVKLAPNTNAFAAESVAAFIATRPRVTPKTGASAIRGRAMTATCIMGIDPGLSGAVAFYFPSVADRSPARVLASMGRRQRLRYCVLPGASGD